MKATQTAYLLRSIGYTSIGPPIPSLKMPLNTIRSKSTMLAFDTNRFSHGWGASHIPVALACSSTCFTRNRNSE